MLTSPVIKRSFVVISKYFSTAANIANIREQETIKSWQVHTYGGIEQFQLTKTRIPIIQDPSEVLVRVEAASINPIDLMMAAGYGRTLINLIRFEDELPLTPGRDFCGTVLSKGHEVDDAYKVGDRVYGFKPLNQQGTFSEVISVHKSFIRPKPLKLTHIESASLVYASMTAWSALYITGGLLLKNPYDMRVLVLGASGGVGTAAVQLLKSQGCRVFATCSEDAVSLVKSLGADIVFDYKDSNYKDNVADAGRYHIVLDCAKIGSKNLPEKWSFDTYIALNSPLLINTDTHGLIPGLCTSAGDFIQANLQDFGRKFVGWGFFMPFETGFKFIDNLILKGKIQPVIYKTFKYEELPNALKAVSSGHLRGKVVIDCI